MFTAPYFATKLQLNTRQMGSPVSGARNPDSLHEVNLATGTSAGAAKISRRQREKPSMSCARLVSPRRGAGDPSGLHVEKRKCDAAVYKDVDFYFIELRGTKTILLYCRTYNR